MLCRNEQPPFLFASFYTELDPHCISADAPAVISLEEALCDELAPPHRQNLQFDVRWASFRECSKESAVLADQHFPVPLRDARHVVWVGLRGSSAEGRPRATRRMIGSALDHRYGCGSNCSMPRGAVVAFAAPDVELAKIHLVARRRVTCDNFSQRHRLESNTIGTEAWGGIAADEYVTHSNH